MFCCLKLWFSLHACCLCVRLVSLVVRLREWAHRNLLEQEERPDSFLERFRGPEFRVAPSRTSDTQPDANGNNAKGIFRYVCLPPWTVPLHGVFAACRLVCVICNLSGDFRKKCKLFVVSQSDDAYYRWLFVIATAVLYNWFIVVAR